MHRSKSTPGNYPDFSHCGELGLMDHLIGCTDGSDIDHESSIGMNAMICACNIMKQKYVYVSTVAKKLELGVALVEVEVI